MKIYLKYILPLLVVMNTSASFAQGLKAGDTCPDMALKHIMNYSTAALKLSSLKGKIVILDFWSPGCAGCLKGFPVLDSLQNRFGDSIQIFLVNKETEDSIKHFFAVHKTLKKPALPFITSDRLLHKTFPREAYPYQVWLDKNSIVRAITYAENGTPENVEALLHGKDVFVETAETIYDYDASKPYIAEGNGRWLSEVKYCSYIMNPSIHELGVREYSGPFGEADDTNELRNRIIIQGYSIPYLYAYAFGEKKYDFYPANCIILQVKDSSKYIRPADKNLWDAWDMKNLYTYDLMVPPDKINQRFRFMQQDLERYFNATGTIEKRKIKCVVLVKTSDTDKLKSKGGKFNISHNRTPDGDSVVYQNAPFEYFTWNLKNWFSGNRFPEPFVDGTGYTGNIDMHFINIDFNGDEGHSINLQGFRNILNVFVLDLKEEEYLTDVLVIKEEN